MKIIFYILFFSLIGILSGINPFASVKEVEETEKKIPENTFIEELLNQFPTKFKNILNNPSKYQVQIIYTQINRDKDNVPSFKQYTYHVDSKNYFYPASLVKLPCTALALEKLNKLKIAALTKNTCMYTDSAFACQKKITEDTTAFDKKPSVAQYIKRMLLISDDDAYGRMYEFLGQQYINEELEKKGYPNIRIIHRFDPGCNTLQNKYTNPISFYNAERKCIYQQPIQINNKELHNPLGTVKKGIGYVDWKGKLVREPKDYSYMNYLCLQDISDILKSIIFPNNVEKEKRFELTTEDYEFLYKYLSMYPRESDYPRYNPKIYKDSFKKYFMYGSYPQKISVDSVRIYNVVGQSYGYLSDCAYVVNVDKKIEFMLSAVIYVNEDEIVNDGKYEYETIGFPFLTDLGNVIYDYESKRKKEYLPDFTKFKLR